MQIFGTFRRLLVIAGLATLVVIGGMIGVWWAVRDDGQRSPALPEVDGDPALVIAGVAFVDDGDGVLGGGDVSVVGAQVRLGVDSDYLRVDSASTITGADGSFVLHAPRGLDASTPDLFVELGLATDGPPGGGAPSTIAVRVDVHFGMVDIPIALHALPHRCESLTSGDCGATLLPDLVPLLEGVSVTPDNPMPADGWLVDATSQPGSTLLRFPSVTANSGDGPLQVLSRPSGPPVDDVDVASAEVWQRVFRTGLGYVDLPSGTFTFHESHHHVHLDNFEEYRLLDLQGNVVVAGTKVSFCLMDSFQVIGSDRPSFGVFRPLGECGAEEQSINVGWTDYYGAGLPDQWIDVTGVPAGDYLVEIVIDPDNVLLETNEDNNSVRFPVTLP